MGRYVERMWTPSVEHGLGTSARKGGPYQAFIPTLLRELEFRLPPALSRRIAAVEAEIRGLTSHSVAGIEGLSRFLLRSEAIASSQIEGIAPNSDKVAIAEVAHASHGEVYGVKGSAELVARNVAILQDFSELIRSGEDITVELLESAQHQLISNARATGVRKEQNWIGGSSHSPLEAEFVPAPPDDVPGLLDDLMVYVNGADHATLTQAAVAHAQFETIHPFPDGNGRIGRALIHAVLQRRCLTAGPTLPVSVVLATRSDRYIEALTGFRDGDVIGWIEYFVDSAAIAAEHAGSVFETVERMQQEWEDAVRAERQAKGQRTTLRKDSAEYKILSGLPSYPLLTAQLAADKFGISVSSARAALDNLANIHILRKKVIGKGSLNGYLADGIFDLLDGTERRLASTQFDTRISEPVARGVPRRSS